MTRQPGSHMGENPVLGHHCYTHFDLARQELEYRPSPPVLRLEVD